MKANVFFTLHSFSFNGATGPLIESLVVASSIVKKMESDKFIQFSKSSDFYNDVTNKMYGPGAVPEAGVLMSLVYDGALNNTSTREFTSEEVVNIVNKQLPILDNRWVAIYGTLPDFININYPIRNVITEKNIIEYSKVIVKSNKLTPNEYSEAFEGIYRNFIFHPNYNDVNNISGGCDKFIDGVFEMFDAMNDHIPKDGDTEEDITHLNKKIKFTTCEEGGGKKGRKNNDKKLDFEFEIDGVKSDYNCEYHCKLEFMDGQYKTGKYHDDNRMYFGFYKPEGKANKFLIAHLGDHL